MSLGKTTAAELARFPKPAPDDVCFLCRSTEDPPDVVVMGHAHHVECFREHATSTSPLGDCFTTIGDGTRRPKWADRDAQPQGDER